MSLNKNDTMAECGRGGTRALDAGLVALRVPAKPRAQQALRRAPRGRNFLEEGSLAVELAVAQDRHPGAPLRVGVDGSARGNFKRC